MIYVTIPVHNEARTLGVLLWKVRRVMEEFGRDFRILVLDDASTDETSEVLDRYDAFLPLDVVRAEERIGTLRAVDRLFRRALEETRYPKRDVVVTFQADFTDDPADLVDLVKRIEGGADIVVGAPSGPSSERLPWRERFVRWAAPRVLGSAYREAPVSDPLSGFRAIRIVVLKKALREQGDRPLAARSGFAGNLELLARLAPHARRIEETEVALRPHLRRRPSRSSVVPVLRELFGLRRAFEWDSGLP